MIGLKRFARAAAVLAAMAVVACAVRGGDPDALWKIVHGRCTPDWVAHRDPAPCAKVALEGDVARGYAVLKDRVGVAQYLVIPTARVTGIESPALLAPGAPNYWQDAWQARGFVDARLGRVLPRDDLGIAVNSMFGRTQDQLHLHVDCIRPDVRDALRRDRAGIGTAWTPVTLAGRIWLVRRLNGADLEGTDPFRLLAEEVPGARAQMGRETLAVTGATFAGGVPGFYVVAGRADLAAGNPGSAEELLDHDCAVARAVPRP